MNKCTSLVLSGLMLLAGSSISSADSGDVHIVTRYSSMQDRVKTYHPTNREAHRLAWAITNDKPGMISRDLHNTPVHAHMAEVRVDHQTIYIDPDVDYIRKDRHVRMNPNYLTKALNEHRYQATNKHRIVRRDYGMLSEMQMAGMGRIVIFRNGMHGDNLGSEPGMKMIPSVPSNPDKTNDDLMVADTQASPTS